MKSEYGSSIFVYEFAFSRAIRYGSRAPNALAQIAFSMQKKIKCCHMSKRRKKKMNEEEEKNGNAKALNRRYEGLFIK